MSHRGLSDERWRKIWEIFHAALELPEADRDSHVEIACGGDEDLRREVQELLAADQQGLAMLDESPPAPGIVADLEETAVAERGLLRIGSRVAERFEIVRLIGLGGMGEVYEAHDHELDSRVALKTLLPALSSNPSALTRFRKETLLARQVTHPNVCRIFDFYQHEGLVFLTMEYLEGETLASVMKREGRLDLQASEKILGQLVAGLEAAHAAGVVHRDLKPANVILVDGSSRERAVITDFGLATTHLEDADAAIDPQLTRTGEILGTPAYMAPEQLAGAEVGPATDIYALGLILFEMVTGQRPFTGGTAFSIASRRLEGSAPSPRSHLPELEERWERVIQQCLERKPEDRYRSPSEILRALQPGSSAEPGLDAAGQWPRWVAAVVLFGFVAVAIWLVRQQSGGEVTSPDETSPAIGASVQPERLDTILVADFENRSGDSELDGIVEPALAREMGHSSAVAVATRGRVRDALRLMRLPADTRLDDEIARQVARRDGQIRAVLSGTVAPSGTGIMVSASLVDVTDGSVLGSWSEDAGPDGARIGTAVRAIADDVRRFLGENADRIETGLRDRQIVTTSSLRALRLYEEAEALVARSGQDGTAEELLRDAIREDPEFASAHLLLAYAVLNQGRPAEEYVPLFERALELSEEVPDRERYFIRASYFYNTGDRSRAVSNYEALLRLHPDHYWGNNNLAFILGPTAGVPYQVRKATYRPNDLDANWDAAHALAIIGNRPSEAQPFIDQVVSLAEVEIPRWQDYEATWARTWEAHRQWLGGDLEGAREHLDRWATALERMTGGEEVWTRRLLASCYRTLGLVERAESVLPLPEWALSRQYYRALNGALGGRSAAVLPDLLEGRWSERGWASVLMQDPTRLVGLLDAGETGAARDLLVAFDAHPRSPTPTVSDREPNLRNSMGAMLGLAEGSTDDSLARLESAMSHDRETYDPVYYLSARALAVEYSKQGREDDAVAVLSRSVAERARCHPFACEHWMRAKLDLARLLRDLGEDDEADRLGAELGELVGIADENFWLLDLLRESAEH